MIAPQFPVEIGSMTGLAGNGLEAAAGKVDTGNGLGFACELITSAMPDAAAA